MQDLERDGMVSVITGGAGGIGMALGRALVARGGRVAVSDMEIERAQAAAKELGGGCRGYACDVTDREDVAAFAAHVLADFGRVNLVFANAGVALGGKLTDTDPREFDWLFDVNVRGAFNTTHAFSSALLSEGASGRTARFILTGSENSFGLPTLAEMTAYTATKHAILAMADGLRRDMAGTGVGVTCLCPGLVRSRVWNSRAHRHDRYGGPELPTPEKEAAMMAHMDVHGLDPDVMARMCLDGIDNDEFLVITHPHIRDLWKQRNAQIETALAALDARLAASN